MSKPSYSMCRSATKPQAAQAWMIAAQSVSGGMTCSKAVLKSYVAATSARLATFSPDPVASLCNNCFGDQENCPYIKLSLLGGAIAVRMQ